MNSAKPRVLISTMHHMLNIAYETIHWSGNSDPEVELQKIWDTHYLFVSIDEVSVLKFNKNRPISYIKKTIIHWKRKQSKKSGAILRSSESQLKGPT